VHSTKEVPHSSIVKNDYREQDFFCKICNTTAAFDQSGGSFATYWTSFADFLRVGHPQLVASLILDHLLPARNMIWLLEFASPLFCSKHSGFAFALAAPALVPQLLSSLEKWHLMA
jgi:hypothetical protein